MSAYVEAAAQFENANALRNYPFAEKCSLVDDLGRPLPPNVVVDLRMLVPADVPAGIRTESPEVSMTSVHLSRAMVSVCFVSKFRGKASALSVTVSAGDLKPYVPYRMDKLAGSEDIGGIVTFGEMELPGFPETYRFSPGIGNAVVHPCCVAVASPARLRGFVDPRSGNRISGDVNIEFSGYVESERSGEAFRLSLADGAASELASRCEGLADGADVCGATPIRTINGIRPDEDGNIVLWFH